MICSASRSILSDYGNIALNPSSIVIERTVAVIPLPHAVSSIANGAINTTFSYDANGNQTAGLGRTIAYTSYNKQSSITQGTRTLSFSHDFDHQRFKQVSPEGTILYFDAFGIHAELNVSTGQWNECLSV